MKKLPLVFIRLLVVFGVVISAPELLAVPGSAGASEYFSTTNSLPPTNTVYISPATYHALYANGIVIKDVRHHFFTQSTTPTTGKVVENFNSTVDLQLSTDSGATFHSVTAPASVSVQVTFASQNGVTNIYSTEMLSLNLSGGTLPSGLMVRESPTLASTGQTTIRPVSGGYMISSFFDIFTEVSLDGGSTWTPASSGPVHVVMEDDPASVPAVGEPSNILPPPADEYVSPAQWHALFANGVVIKDVRHKLFTGASQPPANGATNGVTESFNSQVDAQISTDGGNTFQSVRAPAPVTIVVSNSTSTANSSNSFLNTEMTSLNVTFPVGSTSVMLRESPTMSSLGAVESDKQSDGSYHISSFFDIFTELSLDGGNTWSPATNGPVRMQLTSQAPEVPTSNGNLPVTNTPYVSPAQWHALYANGIILTNVSHSKFTQTQPPPAPGATNTEVFGSSVTGQISLNGGASFAPFSVSNANVAVTVISRSNLDNGGTRYFDTEMTSLNLSGGTLPSGLMVRESPTKQSLGRTSVRTNSTGGYMVSSFFDIFTEVSLDGGNTWSPQVNAPGTMSPGANVTTNCMLSISCPANITVTSSVPTVVFYTVTASDSCGGVPSIISTPPSGSTFPLGMTTVISTASDANGSTSCSFTVTVVPPVNPPIVLNCPSNITVTATTSSGANVFFNVNASGGCSTPNVTAVPPSDSTFPIGTTTVYTSASDTCGQVTNCSFTVTVNPPSYPPLVLTCPSNITVTATSSSGANVFFSVNAGGGCSTPNITAVPPSGSTFPIGTTTVYTSASDACGQVTNCSFTVTVNPPVYPPIVLTCPSNITTMATSQSGAVVFFTVSASGGCSPPPFVTANPPSGSAFPIGTTTVTTTASDTCGNSTNCSFTVTVLTTNCALSINCPANITVTSSVPTPVFYTVTASDSCGGLPIVNSVPPSGSAFPLGTTTVTSTASDANGSTNCSFTITVVSNTPTAQVNEYYEPTNSLPPTNTVYISPAQWHALYANGIVIRDVRHRFFTQSFAPPPLGTTSNETFNSELDYNLSTDGGATYHPATGTAVVTVQVTHSSDSGGTSFFNTEMLQLDLTGGGLLLRESPTLQSTGQTTIRPVSGGYMISSFFDIFTEVSLDGGNTWVPSQGPGHMEMRPDPLQVPGTGEPTPLLPAPDDAYVSPAQWHALYAQGVIIKNVSHKLFTGSLLPPAAGVTNTHSFNSILDLDVSTDGGKTFQSLRATNAPVQVTVGNSSSSTDNPIYDTEMTLLNLTLPNGIMVRESPTLPSRGMTEIDAQSDGTYKISSFFDIFTELSLDGGNTWSPTTNGPVRMQLTPQAPEVPATGGNLPLTNRPYVSPAQWHALFANGIILTNVSHSQFTANYPPPAPGQTNTESFGSMVDGQISLNGGATFQPFAAPAAVSVNVTSRSNLDNGATRFYDTEITSLNVSGGSLPGGVMLRESPTKQSLGRTSVRTNSTGNYMISSFFDIFTEVSLDGGNTWSPSISQPVPMTPMTNCLITIACPPSITVTSVGPAVVFFTVTAGDSCGNTLAVTTMPPSGSTFTEGTTTVTSTASNADGTNTCSFTVTVVAKQRVFPSGGKLPPTNSLYISPAQWHALYANGIYISNVVHRAFTANFPPPSAGTTSNETFGSKVDFMYSTDGGHTFTKYTGNATCTVKVTNAGTQGGGQLYTTEMLQLDLSGGSMPANVRLRESPTLQSTGQTLITPSSGGNYMISSFFDIFTELSLDGGNTWMPSSSSGHMELHIDPSNPPTTLVQPQYNGTQLAFNVPTQPGLRYTVQYTGDLATQSWTTLTVVSGNGQNLAVSDPQAGTAAHRFYRVVIDEDPNQ